MEKVYRPLKGERMQLRVTAETQYRIKQLAKLNHTSMTAIIERLVDDAWMDQIAIPGFQDRMKYPD